MVASTHRQGVAELLGGSMKRTYISYRYGRALGMPPLTALRFAVWRTVSGVWA